MRLGRSRILYTWVLIWWIAVHDCSELWLSEGCLEQERSALIEIRDSISYPNGHGLSWGHATFGNFSSEDNCCRWAGIKCDPSSRVITIDIPNRREATLGSWYPTARHFTSLEKLRILRLDGNRICGWNMSQGDLQFKSLDTLSLANNRLNETTSSLSWLCMLGGINYLNLGGNQLNDSSIPQCFKSLSSLANLQLGNNNFSTLLAIEGLCGLMNLQILDLHGNLLRHGSIPPCLSNLPQLHVLDLSNNQFGEIYSFAIQDKVVSVVTRLCGLTHLQELHLHDNRLHHGSIPPCLSNLSQLQLLDLSNNQFGEIIPSAMLTKLYSLKHLDLSNSQFTGVFSFSLLAHHSNLSYVDLSNNHRLEVQTEVPSWVPFFQLTYLNLSNCSLNANHGGSIPNFLETQKRLQTIDLSFSGLKGSIPIWLLENTRHVELSNNSLDGDFPSPSQPANILYIGISNNNISGRLPPDMNTLFPFLVNLSLSSNALEGSILPTHCNNTYLSTLDLSHNMLTGAVPPNLFTDCNSLKILKLANNKLHGEMVPLDSKPLISQSLEVLNIGYNNLSGSINSWLKWFASAPKMEFLIIRNNGFDGPIPNETCQMHNLRILDLSNNKLSGLIPACLSEITPWIESDMNRQNSSLDEVAVEITTKGRTTTYTRIPLSKMTTIDLSMNTFNGFIPVEMGFLKGLHSLNLSYNDLMGSIPSSFGQLHELESLDLSHNQLSGRIPSELQKLDYLAYLSLASNNLSGKIPQSPHFDTFNKNSYEGNPFLCGKPLQEDCPLQAPQPMPVLADEEEDEEEGRDLILYACVMVSHAIGFWGFIALLFLRQDWRHSYFRNMNTCICFCYYHLLGSLEKLSACWGRFQSD